MINPTLSVDAAQAEYWNGSPTRKEVQKPFDELSDAINGLTASMSSYNLAMAFVMMKLAATPEEFQAFIAAKTAEMKAAAETPQVKVAS